MPLHLPDTIEFINGPFDGHIEVLAVAAEALPGNLACFVTKNMLRLMNGQYRVHDSAVTSVAIYEREHRLRGWVYVFSGVRAPQGAKFKSTQASLFGNESTDDS